MRLQPQSGQRGMGGVVVVLLRFLARIGNGPHGNIEADHCARLDHEIGELVDRERFGELVVDLELSLVWWIVRRERHALQRVEQVQVAARLATLAEHGQGNARHRLRNEAVHHCAEQIVVVEVRPQAWIGPRLLGLDAVNRTLHKVGDAQAVGANKEPDQVRVEHLGGMVEAGGLAGKQEAVRAALVIDIDPTLLDIDVRRPVFAHRAELDQVGIGCVAQHGPQDVVRGAQVVPQGQVRLGKAPHGVGRRRLLGVVHDHIGLLPRDQRLERGHVVEVEVVGLDPQVQRIAGDRAPFAQAGGCDERIAIGSGRQLAPKPIVDPHDRVSARGEVQSGRPSQIAVSTTNQDPHSSTSFLAMT